LAFIVYGRQAMKRYLRGMVGFLIILISLAVAATAQDALKEGKWSMTMVTHMDNMSPEMAAAMQQMQNMTPEAKAAMQKAQEKMGFQVSSNGQDMTVMTTHCITNQNPVPQHLKDMNMENYCQQTHEINGGTVKFHLTCDHDDFQMESSGTMTYAGDSMTGSIKSHEVKAGKTLDSTINITGQYVGPC